MRMKSRRREARRWSRLVLLALVLSVVAAVHGMTRATKNAALTPTFPGDEWQRIAPAQAGFDSAEWDAWAESQTPRGSEKYGEQHTGGRWGVVLTRGGYLVASWGDPDYRYQSASVGKAFTKLVLQLAIDEGLIASDRDLVSDYWTGEGQLSHPHKYLNRGYHRELTFQHLWQHKGGFPVTNGYFWAAKENVPFWAQWSGDPGYDNYAHIQPGLFRSYSSGGYWRLSQALTAIWGKNLKDVLDEKLFSEMGISPDRWDWLSGQHVHDTTHLYPEMPGYGAFVDPPYSIDGQMVLGGGGWVVMSAKDLARVGLLIATGGVWCGKRLISDTRLLEDHLGGNNSALIVRRGDLTVWAQVTAAGISFPRQLTTAAVDEVPAESARGCSDWSGGTDYSLRRANPRPSRP